MFDKAQSVEQSDNPVFTDRQSDNDVVQSVEQSGDPVFTDRQSDDGVVQSVEQSGDPVFTDRQSDDDVVQSVEQSGDPVFTDRQSDNDVVQSVEQSGDPIFTTINLSDLLLTDDDAKQSDNETMQSVEQSKKHVYDPEYRLKRRKRMALRRKMLSYGEPKKRHILCRVIPPPESSDDEIEDELENVPKQKMSRKRFRYVHKWKRNVIKKARETGQAYVSHSGKCVKEKTAPVSVSLCNHCRYKCNEHVDDDSRTALFSSYYELPSDAQNVYLFSCLMTTEPKYRLVNAESQREVSVIYNVNVKGTPVRVCKQAFMKLHAISQSKVDHIISQKKSGLTMARMSMRGKHDNRVNRLPEHQRNLVQEHIKSYPSESSHYSRFKNDSRKYLCPTLSVNKMFTQYSEKCQQSDVPPVSSAMYRAIFCSDFNLGFGSPRSDTCSRCETLTDNALEQHKKMAEAAFASQRRDREEARQGNVMYITFDMEKTLPLPKLSVSDAFYLRQLWLYNTGIHAICDEKEAAYFQIWTENEGGRGVNEVCSSLLTFFDVNRVKNENCTELTAWSDSCGGQNKNFAMICFWQYLVLSGRFSRIDHKFPEPGHSFLDSDRDFGKIETVVKRTQNVYSIDEYQAIMISSGRKQKTAVTRIGDKMVNVSALVNQMGLRKKTVDVNGSKVELRDKVRWISVSEFGVYKFRHSLSEDEPWKEVRLLHSNTPVAMPLLNTEPKKQIPIRAAKYRDLMKQLQYIPSAYQGLYLGLSSDEANEQTVQV